MLIQESLVDYADGDIACRGLLVHQPSPGRQPGVVLFPDARGLGETAKGCARRVAELGFIVFIADLYGQGIFTDDIPRAHELMTLLRSGDFPANTALLEAAAPSKNKGTELHEPAHAFLCQACVRRAR